MQDVPGMQSLECLDNLYKDEPDTLLVDVLLLFLMLDNLLVEISIVEKVHHQTETGRSVLKKGLFVTDYAIMTIHIAMETKC